MKHYTILADLFQYPYEGFDKTVYKISTELKKKYSETESVLEVFVDFTKKTSYTEMQEHFMRTFEIKALCNLDVGFVLFGEDYKRGKFLVKIQQEHKKAGNDCGTELGDYLPNMLKLLPKIEDEKFAGELAYTLMIPAVKQMIMIFLDLKNPYLKLLHTLLMIMEKDFGNLDYNQIIIADKKTKEFYRKPGRNPEKFKKRTI